MSACKCCSEPLCYTPSVVETHEVPTEGKYYPFNWDAPIRYYSTQTEVHSLSWTGPSGSFETANYTIASTKTTDGDGVCQEAVTMAGSVIYSSAGSGSRRETNSVLFNDMGSWKWRTTETYYNGSGGVIGTPTTASFPWYIYPGEGGFVFASEDITSSTVKTTTYSVGAPKTGGGTITTTLSDIINEVLHLTYHLSHSPTGTCYLKAWLRTVFLPTSTPEDPPPSPVYTDLDPYEWEGETTPCIPLPNSRFDSESNMITGPESDEIELAALDDGSTNVEVSKFSCVKGYEPDITDEENPQPNGFPDPAWEAAAP